MSERQPVPGVYEWPRSPADCDHSAALATIPAIDISDDELGALPSHEVRSRFPRFWGQCPACKQQVIAYHSFLHYIAGDW